MGDEFNGRVGNMQGGVPQSSCIFLRNDFELGQITIIPKPEYRAFWGDSLTKPPLLGD